MLVWNVQPFKFSIIPVGVWPKIDVYITVGARQWFLFPKYSYRRQHTPATNLNLAWLGEHPIDEIEVCPCMYTSTQHTKGQIQKVQMPKVQTHLAILNFGDVKECVGKVWIFSLENLNQRLRPIQRPLCLIQLGYWVLDEWPWCSGWWFAIHLFCDLLFPRECSSFQSINALKSIMLWFQTQGSKDVPSWGSLCR